MFSIADKFVGPQPAGVEVGPPSPSGVAEISPNQHDANMVPYRDQVVHIGRNVASEIPASPGQTGFLSSHLHSAVSGVQQNCIGVSEKGVANARRFNVRQMS
ncbi:MAG: hypothetical protein H6868_10300 [Rhodospirillales bacterium]|nr:hypothetical protein [Rhodospirillales bacterium]